MNIRLALLSMMLIIGHAGKGQEGESRESPVTPWAIDSLFEQLYDWHEGSVMLKDGRRLQEDINFNFLADALTTREYYKTGEGQYFPNDVEWFHLKDSATGLRFEFVSAVGELTKKDKGVSFFNVIHHGDHYLLLARYNVRWELMFQTRFVLHGVRWTLYMLGPNGLMRYGFVTYDEERRLQWYPNDGDYLLGHVEPRRLRKVDMKAIWSVARQDYPNLVKYAEVRGLQWNKLEDLVKLLDHLDKIKS